MGCYLWNGKQHEQNSEAMLPACHGYNLGIVSVRQHCHGLWWEINTGIFYNMRREVICFREERTSLGNVVNIIRKKRAREQYKGGKDGYCSKKK